MNHAGFSTVFVENWIQNRSKRFSLAGITKPSNFATGCCRLVEHPKTLHGHPEALRAIESGAPSLDAFLITPLGGVAGFGGEAFQTRQVRTVERCAKSSAKQMCGQLFGFGVKVVEFAPIVVIRH